MIQCAVDHEAVTVGNQVSATADVFVESGDEPDGFIEDIGATWRQSREDQPERRRARCPKRIAEIRRGLPEGFLMEVLNDGDALKITGPKGFTLVYYPVHQKVHYRDQWRTMRASTVVKLLKEWSCS